MKNLWNNPFLNRWRYIYLLCDFVSFGVGWFVFSVVRYFILPKEWDVSLWEWLMYPQALVGQAVVPLVMVFILAFAGLYNRRELTRRTRGEEIAAAFGCCFVGMMLMYLIVLVNDPIPERAANYELMLTLLGCLFIPEAVVRYILTRRLRHSLAKGKFMLRAILVGRPDERKRMSSKLKSRPEMGWFTVCGGCTLPEAEDMAKALDAEVVILASESKDPQFTAKALSSLYSLGIPVYVSPKCYHHIDLRVNYNTVAGEKLVNANGEVLTPFNSNCKRSIDILLSTTALALIWPVMLAVAIAVKREDKGPVIYSQKREGRYGREFTIYKFRTMRIDSESDGRPRLSSKNDSRVTKIGHWLRKYRLDELPQLWNILRGDMSVVGPRPERKYFAAQLRRLKPQYILIQHLRPGLTSLGSVKYGYASNVNEMLKRFDIEMMYLRNISVLMDFKILFYTVRTVISGKGV